MSHKKRKNLHKCSYHKKRPARGRCADCGNWLCSECAKLTSGRFYCRGGCLPANTVKPEFGDLSPKPVVPERKKEKPQKKLKTKSHKVKKESSGTNKILLPLTFLFTLSLLITILLVTRRNITLEKELTILTEKNNQLTEIIKKRNLYIKRLKEREGILKEPEIEENKKPRKGTSSSSIISRSNGKPYSYRKGFIPLSFNNGSTDKKLIALTFDGGSHRNAVNEILDTLKSRDVQSTMFFTGEFIRKNRSLINRILDLKHEAGNHSYSHLHLTNWANSKSHSTLDNINRDVILRELERTNELFKKVTGRNLAPLWRAPYGESNSEINSWGQDAGYIHIGWKQARSWWLNYDTNDWVPDRETPGYYSGAQVLEKVEKLSKKEPYGMNGAIMLWHLGTVRKNREEQAHLYLGKIIDILHERGYRFVTISEMLEESGVDISKLRRRG